MKPLERSLLQADDGHPVSHLHPRSSAPILLVCEHAGYQMPSSLGTLGLSREALRSHIGWDIGALAVAQELAKNLPGELIHQRYSRLVVDCNRPLGSSELIPEISAGTPIPGNTGISGAQRERRIAEIWDPFSDAIAHALDERERRAVPTVLVTVHSFTPALHGVDRPWHIGLLFNRNDDLATRLAHHLRVEAPNAVIGLNEPYRVSDDDDNTIPRFGEARGIPHVLVEIRNDLVREIEGQSLWGNVLARSLHRCLEEFCP